MIRETLIHIDEDLAPMEKEKLLKGMCLECGVEKPRRMTRQPHMMFVPFEDMKVSMRMIPAIALQLGVHAELIEM